jgi:hypothetical protein
VCGVKSVPIGTCLCWPSFLGSLTRCIIEEEAVRSAGPDKRVSRRGARACNSTDLPNRFATCHPSRSSGSMCACSLFNSRGV